MVVDITGEFRTITRQVWTLRIHYSIAPRDADCHSLFVPSFWQRRGFTSKSELLRPAKHRSQFEETAKKIVLGLFAFFVCVSVIARMIEGRRQEAGGRSQEGWGNHDFGPDICLFLRAVEGSE